MKEAFVFPVEDALEMVLVFGTTGIVSYANAAARKKLGYGEPEQEGNLEGRHISDIFPNTFKATEDGFETEEVFGEESGHFVMYRKNFTCFPVEAKIVKICSGDYVCMANDMLEREHLGREIGQVREEAQKAAKVKSEFVANVTHELRTPVNGILGNVKELAGEVKDPHTLKTLHVIERCCEDMNKIINNILDFSKLDAGKFTLEVRKFCVRNMLDYVKAQHMGRITEKGLDFFMTVSPQVPEYVEGDELRIVQILNNLLSNALKFTSVGKITVQVLKTAQVENKVELFFIVSDTGIGIAEEDRGKLFRSFSQVDASISRKYGGTGLGLNICKQLVELMGGTIEVESRKTRGSVFSFSIWVGACGERQTSEASDDVAAVYRRMATQVDAVGKSRENIRIYGTTENQEAMRKNMSKLILCVEMENWEKAEMLMETVRQLTEEAPPEIKRMVLKLKMAIQRESYDKVIAEYDQLYHSSLDSG